MNVVCTVGKQFHKFPKRVAGQDTSCLCACLPKHLDSSVIRKQNLPIVGNPRHGIWIQLEELGKLLNPLFAQAAPDFLAANVGDALHDPQVMWLEESLQRVFAVDHTNDVAIAQNWDGHLAASKGVVDNVVLVG